MAPLYPLLQWSWSGGILASPCQSVWTESCPLCIFHNTSQIHSKFTYLINQIRKVCHVLSFYENFKIKILPNIFISSLSTSCFGRLWMSGHISGMDGPTNMEQNKYELMRCVIHYLTLIFDASQQLALDCQGQILKQLVFRNRWVQFMDINTVNSGGEWMQIFFHHPDGTIDYLVFNLI